MAEFELSVLAEQCLDRRLPDQPTPTREVEGWEQERSARGSTINWRFTTDGARIKLKYLYLSLDD